MALGSVVCQHCCPLNSISRPYWNYFNAKELGDTVLGYWRGWLTAAESNNYSIQYPTFSDNMGDLSGMDQACCVSVLDFQGQLSHVPDIRTIAMANRKIIVSRK